MHVSALPPRDVATLTAHGVFLEVQGPDVRLGVWLRGVSGAGKSELGLELISRGHRLVADDAVEFRREAGAAHATGHCPPLLEGFIEVRGLGILNVRRLYGADAVAASARLDLIIDLGVKSEATAEERLAGRRRRMTVLGLEIAEISLPRRVGHNLAVLVEAACRDHRDRAQGYNACEDLIQRQAGALATMSALQRERPCVS